MHFITSHLCFDNILRSCFFFSVPPDILSSGTSDGEVSVLEGENATLSCKASGRPPPRVFWRREKSDFILMRGFHDPLIQGEISPLYPTLGLSLLTILVIAITKERADPSHETRVVSKWNLSLFLFPTRKTATWIPLFLSLCYNSIANLIN